MGQRHVRFRAAKRERVNAHMSYRVGLHGVSSQPCEWWLCPRPLVYTYHDSSAMLVGGKGASQKVIAFRVVSLIASACAWSVFIQKENLLSVCCVSSERVERMGRRCPGYRFDPRVTDMDRWAGTNSDVTNIYGP